MSKPRYDWWGYVKGIIRRYPELCEQYADIHTQCIVPCYYGMPGGDNEPRKVETIAIRMLPNVHQKEYESVLAAVRLTSSLKTGAERLALINLIFWKRSHTLAGAAIKCNVSERTARRWHTDFIKCVAGFYGLLG